ncbi:transmembrane protein, putative [Medicago truncatula]|uniref:Transmembrane protein, putative n=1 Tax=Medicago truncatula TaxID=3880 RepID=G7I959_MEDTR|nr:transmembrane protein, putative [Medicago truncatula]
MERIRKKKMLPSSWVQRCLQLIFVVQLHLIVQDINVISHNDTLEVIPVEPLEVDSLNLQVFLTQYHGHCIQSGAWIESLCLLNFLLLINMIVFTVYFEQWDPGGHLNMFTPFFIRMRTRGRVLQRWRRLIEFSQFLVDSGTLFTSLSLANLFFFSLGLAFASLRFQLRQKDTSLLTSATSNEVDARSNMIAEIENTYHHLS